MRDSTFGRPRRRPERPLDGVILEERLHEISEMLDVQTILLNVFADIGKAFRYAIFQVSLITTTT
jgi:hypothetical protein